VAAVQAGLLHLTGAVVAHEVVPRDDLVDPEAIRAREALADVALQQIRVAHDGVAPPVEQTLVGRGSAAGLAESWRLHGAWKLIR